jgi:CheY-like chemotaxis protein
MDDIGITNIGATIEIIRALLPSRLITIGKDSPLSKPLRQSHLFDAIVKAVGPSKTDSPVMILATPVSVVFQLSAPVLVAEDNVRLQRLLKLQFDDLGVSVAFVSDGLQAIEALRGAPYAMAFMDCQMPNLDGISATQIIRDEERQFGGHIPIVAMTANAFVQDREACLAAGMDDYLAKPVRLEGLRKAIERWATASTSAAHEDKA